MRLLPTSLPVNTLMSFITCLSLTFLGREWVPPETVFIALVPLILVLKNEKNILRAAIYTYVAALGMSIVIFEGIGLLSIWIYLALAVTQPLWFVFVGVAFVAWNRSGHECVALLTLPFFWVSAELLPSLRVFGDFANPFMHIGYSQLGSPIIALAGLSGVSGLSLLIVMVNIIIVVLMSNRIKSLPKPILTTSLLIAGSILTLGFSSVPKRQKDASEIAVGVVQPATSPVTDFISWYDPETQDKVLAQHVDFSRQLTKDGAELILWPEDTLPFSIKKPGDKARLVQALDDIQIPIILGASHGNLASYNAAFLYENASLSHIYDKRSLVPFIEDRFTPGRSPETIDIRGLKVGLGICLDSAYPHVSLETAQKNPDLLVYISSGALIGLTTLPELHLRVTVFRAAELGLPVVFASKSGPSAFISARGEVERVPSLASKAVVKKLSLEAFVTPYRRYGNWIGMLSFAVTAFSISALVIEKFYQRKGIFKEIEGERAVRNLSKSVVKTSCKEN